MLFKKLYYYYHHYKMWNYIVGQLKAHPQAELFSLKVDYIKKNNYDEHLEPNLCYLCSYNKLVKTSDEILCIYCPLRKKYNEVCYNEHSLFRKIDAYVQNHTSPEERIAAAEKIRDCVLFWKNRRYKRNKNESN